ncbi:deaminase, partial [Vogesella mureinivorans]|uniref:deaminase n=1 Tax=Vogesella mureinivorans TaxID=657276 RepID=UPI00197FEF38
MDEWGRIKVRFLFTRNEDHSHDGGAGANNNDTTSHAELNAVRQACQKLQRLSLKDCVVYASGQPCPMCLAAMRMVGVEKIVYAYSN